MSYEDLMEVSVLQEKVGKGKGIKIAILDSGLDDQWDIPVKFAMDMQNKTTDSTDEKGHGTMVTGIVYNIAPEAEYYIFKVLDERGHGSVANIMDGISGAMNLGCDIICLSLGGTGIIPEAFFGKVEQAIRKRIILIAPTGNSGRNEIEFPAHQDGVWAIGGITNDLQRADFSNFGEGIDFVAPAVDIRSSYLDGKYATDSGTSFSAPMIVGFLACIMSYYNNDKTIDYKEILKQGSSKLSNYIDFGNGLPKGSLIAKYLNHKA